MTGLQERRTALAKRVLGDDGYQRAVRTLSSRRQRPRIGRVRFGDLRRVEPVCCEYGKLRGGPVDRYYIEKFLATHANLVTGTVLEIGERAYTERFGPRAAISEEQFQVLARHPMITIGGHTLDHVSLTDVSAAVQRRQLAEGNARLQELTGRPIRTISYPYGRCDAVSRAVAADLGMRLACTSVPAAALADDDPLALPRLQVVESDGDAFARWLSDGHALLPARNAATGREVSAGAP